MSDGSKLLVFPDQVVEKSTMCAGCIHFDADATRNLEEWRPMKEADIEKVKSGILITGVQVPGLDSADIGLRVAALTRDGVTTVEQAYQQVQASIKMAALDVVGGDLERLYEVDQRYAIVKMTEDGIKTGRLGRCRGNGKKANGEPVGFLVFSGYHCHKWTARAGASLAHEGARRLDPLPEELVERANEKAVARARKEGGEK